jgi:iron-sulfur cluster repair protein YtfE (RIC family)
MAEKKISGEMVINEAIRLYPWTLPVFHRYEVDSCCGGANTIAAAARMQGLDLDTLLAELEEAAAGG